MPEVAVASAGGRPGRPAKSNKADKEESKRDPTVKRLSFQAEAGEEAKGAAKMAPKAGNLRTLFATAAAATAPDAQGDDASSAAKRPRIRVRCKSAEGLSPPASTAPAAAGAKSPSIAEEPASDTAPAAPARKAAALSASSTPPRAAAPAARAGRQRETSCPKQVQTGKRIRLSGGSRPSTGGAAEDAETIATSAESPASPALVTSPSPARVRALSASAATAEEASTPEASSAAGAPKSPEAAAAPAPQRPRGRPPKKAAAVAAAGDGDATATEGAGAAAASAAAVEVVDLAAPTPPQKKRKPARKSPEAAAAAAVSDEAGAEADGGGAAVAESETEIGKERGLKNGKDTAAVGKDTVEHVADSDAITAPTPPKKKSKGSRKASEAGVATAKDVADPAPVAVDAASAGAPVASAAAVVADESVPSSKKTSVMGLLRRRRLAANGTPQKNKSSTGEAVCVEADEQPAACAADGEPASGRSNDAGAEDGKDSAGAVDVDAASAPTPPQKKRKGARKPPEAAAAAAAAPSSSESAPAAADAEKEIAVTGEGAASSKQKTLLFGKLVRRQAPADGTAQRPSAGELIEVEARQADVAGAPAAAADAAASGKSQKASKASKPESAGVRGWLKRSGDAAAAAAARGERPIEAPVFAPAPRPVAVPAAPPKPPPLTWCDRHAPKKIADLRPQPKWKQLKTWLATWASGRRPKGPAAVLVTGPTGCGKSTGVALTAQKVNLGHVQEYDLNDREGLALLENVVRKQLNHNQVKGDALLVFEVPSEPSQKIREKLSLAAQNAQSPVIFVAEDGVLTSKDPVTSHCLSLEVRLTTSVCQRMLRDIATREGLDDTSGTVEAVANDCGSDMRKATSALQLLAIGGRLQGVPPACAAASSLTVCRHLLRGRGGDAAMTVEARADLLSMGESMSTVLHENYLRAASGRTDEEALEGCAASAEALSAHDVLAVMAGSSAWAGGAAADYALAEGFLLAAVDGTSHEQCADFAEVREAEEVAPLVVTPEFCARISRELFLPRTWVQAQVIEWAGIKKRKNTEANFKQWIRRTARDRFYPDVRPEPDAEADVDADADMDADAEGEDAKAFNDGELVVLDEDEAGNVEHGTAGDAEVEALEASGEDEGEVVEVEGEDASNVETAPAGADADTTEAGGTSIAEASSTASVDASMTADAPGPENMDEEGNADNTDRGSRDESETLAAGDPAETAIAPADRDDANGAIVTDAASEENGVVAASGEAIASVINDAENAIVDASTNPSALSDNSGSHDCCSDAKSEAKRDAESTSVAQDVGTKVGSEATSDTKLETSAGSQGAQDIVEPHAQRCSDAEVVETKSTSVSVAEGRAEDDVAPVAYAATAEAEDVSSVSAVERVEGTSNTNTQPHETNVAPEPAVDAAENAEIDNSSTCEASASSAPSARTAEATRAEAATSSSEAWEDVPADHKSHRVLKINEKASSPYVSFKIGTVPFQVTLSRAGSREHCLRLARLCYLKLEAGGAKDEVLAFRNEEYKRLQAAGLASSPAGEDAASPDVGSASSSQ